MTTSDVSGGTVRSSVGGFLSGTPVVPGVGYAPVVWPGPRPALPEAAAPELPDRERAAAEAAFRAAAAAVADRLRDRASHSTGVAAEVLATTAGLATDKAWLDAAAGRIRAGVAPPQATVAATDKFVEMFTKVGGLMAERVTDLLDVRDRVLAELAGLPEPGVPQPDSPVILCADDLAPADTAGLDPALVRGIATRLGGPTSHTAIIARQLSIPCVVAVAGLESIAAGTPVLIDGTAGTVEVGPDPDAAGRREAADRERAQAVARWQGPGATADGVPVAILANVQDGVSAAAASTKPVEGVGLFRTELAFFEKATEPTVAEQTALYRAVLDAFPGRKVVIRTLDAGSDKPLKFVDNAGEPNPALGVRGYRIATINPDLQSRQLDAIAEAGEAWVMAPMIATAGEAKAFAEQCRSRGLTPGVMIEVPAAALLIDAILAEVDFVSIGTNDLTQYVMAADRMSSELAELTDPWQPAVLRLIEMVGTAGRTTGKPVGVCGEAAADPLLACVLVGLGVTSLSCAPAAAAAVGAKVAGVTAAQCAAAASAAVAATSAAGARAAVAAILD